jgi:hypothetical protein
MPAGRSLVEMKNCQCFLLCICCQIATSTHALVNMLISICIRNICERIRSSASAVMFVVTDSQLGWVGCLTQTSLLAQSYLDTFQHEC